MSTDSKEVTQLVSLYNTVDESARIENGIFAEKSKEICIKKEYPEIMRERKLLNVIFIQVVIFCITWTPYSLMTVYAQFGTDIEAYITPYTIAFPSLFAKASLIYGPIIFCLADRDTREFLLKHCLLFRSTKNKAAI